MRGNKVDCFKGLKWPLKQNKTKLVDRRGFHEPNEAEKALKKRASTCTAGVCLFGKVLILKQKNKQKKNPSNLGGHEGNLNR